MPKLSKEQNLIIIREHIKESIEGHRKKLSKLWEDGRRDTWYFKRLNEQYELYQDKLMRVIDELCPLPPKRN